jgi:hypothetical protein
LQTRSLRPSIFGVGGWHACTLSPRQKHDSSPFWWVGCTLQHPQPQTIKRVHGIDHCIVRVVEGVLLSGCIVMMFMLSILHALGTGLGLHTATACSPPHHRDRNLATICDLGGISRARTTSRAPTYSATCMHTLCSVVFDGWWWVRLNESRAPCGALLHGSHTGGSELRRGWLGRALRPSS